MTEIQLLPEEMLNGIDIGISVSDSADLSRLGLSTRHAELAIGEITRSVLIAGGRITYGGRIKPSGFTQHLIDEIRRYGTNRSSLTLCLAYPEHRKLDLPELRSIDQQLGVWGRLVALDPTGEPTSWSSDRPEAGRDIDDEEIRRQSYKSLRRFMTSTTNARVLLGGQLERTPMMTPGVIEEAVLTIRSNHPVYVAGGFGGAAAAAATVLYPEAMEWLPAEMPKGINNRTVTEWLEELRQAATETEWSLQAIGLSEEQNRLLSSTHRPGEIASLVTLGLSNAPRN